MKKRIISMLLVLLMVLSTASTCVFATADQVSDSTEVTTNDLNVESTEPLNAGTEDGDAGAVEDTEPAEFKVDSVVANGENGAVVKWSGAPEGSTVLITPVNGSTEGQAQSFSGSAGTASVTGLKAGTTYTFKVDVVDETGASIIQGDPIITPAIISCAMFLTLPDSRSIAPIDIIEPKKADATIAAEFISIPFCIVIIIESATVSLAPDEIPSTYGPAIGLLKKL